MKVITLDKTKELLGITDSSSDVAITAKIPYIDSKVKQITRNRWNMQIVGSTISGSPYIPVYSIKGVNGITYNYNKTDRRYYSAGINNNYSIDDLSEYIETGQLIEGFGIPTDSYIDEVYYDGYDYEIAGQAYNVPFVKISANATATRNSTQMFLGISIAYQDIIAKGIQYLINSTNTSTNKDRVISVGTVSYSDSEAAIDGKYGMPSWFVKAFPKYAGGH